MGGPLDFETPRWAGQCKNEKTRSLAALSRLAQEVEEEGVSRGKHGVLVIKHRAGGGVKTPMLVVMTAAAWNTVQAERGRLLFKVEELKADYRSIEALANERTGLSR